MHTNVNLLAPIGALLFLGAAFLLFVAGVALLFSVIRRNPRLARLSFIAFVLITGSYLAVLLIFSLASTEQVLAHGEEKHFCEIDCHLAYSITGTRVSKTLGEGSTQVTANGLFHVVTIKTHFDEHTIGRNR
jgi:hypothetical protein